MEIEAVAVSRGQALAQGLSDSALFNLVSRGRWQRLYPGTFAPYSGPVPREAWLTAAVLYAGEGAALSHRTAAVAAGWLRGHPVIHVTVPERRRVRGQPGLIVHRSRNWSVADVLTTASPARTTVERTLIDLVRAARTESDVVALVTRAVGSRHTHPARILAAMEGVRCRHRGLLLEMVEESRQGVHSSLEHRFLGVIRRHGLPKPVCQDRHEASDGRVTYRDTLFVPWGAVAELDGLDFHSEPDDRFRDAERDNANVVLGLAPLRFGWRGVVGRECLVAHQVAAVLTRLGWPGRIRLCGTTCGPG